MFCPLDLPQFDQTLSCNCRNIPVDSDVRVEIEPDAWFVDLCLTETRYVSKRSIEGIENSSLFRD